MPGSSWVKALAPALLVVAAMLYALYEVVILPHRAVLPAQSSGTATTAASGTLGSASQDAVSNAAPASFSRPATSPGMSNGASNDAPQIKPDLALLKAQCVEEVRANHLPVPGTTSACEQFAAASKASLPAVTAPVRSDPLVAMQNISRSMQMSAGNSATSNLICPPAPQANCELFYPKGSIAYRECRVRFKNDLVQQCAKLKNQLDSGLPQRNGDACLPIKEERYCAAAASFQPVEG